MNKLLFIIFFSTTLMLHGQNKGLVYESNNGYITTPVNVDATLTGNGTDGSPLSVVGGSYVISPSQITGDQDNYSPTNWDDATIVRIDASSIWEISSFAAPTSSSKPQSKLLINVGSSSFFIPGEHPDGTPANRVALGMDYIVYPYQSVTLFYDNTSTRWRITDQPINIPYKGIYNSFSPGSVTAADHPVLGMFPMGTAAANTGTASTTSVPGCIAMSTGTTSTGAVVNYFNKITITWSAYGAGHLWAETFVSIPTVSDVTNTFVIICGLSNTAGSYSSITTNNSTGFKYTDGVNSGKFQGYSKNNAGSETTVDLGVTVSAGTTYLLRVEVDKANTESRFYINNAYAGRITANRPNNVVVGSNAMIVKTVGSTARTLSLHTMSSGVHL